jgi:hypothetical protein
MNIECSMGKGPSLVCECLLYMHGSLANVTSTGLILCAYSHTGQIEDFLQNSLVQDMRLLPEHFKRLQGWSTVFFPA